jgi:hypothetical protein
VIDGLPTWSIKVKTRLRANVNDMFCPLNNVRLWIGACFGASELQIDLMQFNIATRLQEPSK